MKFILLITIILLNKSLVAQTSRDTSLVFDLTPKVHYEENNKFWRDSRDSSITIWQELNYNEDQTIDEEYTQVLIITMHDPEKLSDKQTLDLVTDSALITSSFEKISVWNWSKRKVAITGKLSIITIGKNKITLSFDIVVTETGSTTFVYRGARTFRKSKPVINRVIDLK